MGLNRMRAFAALKPELGDSVVVSALGYASWCLYAAAHRESNLYLRGSMGLGVPVGLGIALAAPRQRVVVCEGDGSVLMNLGALSTVGSYRPANLTVLVFDDGRYLTTGGQVTHTARGTDLAKVGLAVGVRSCRTVRDEASLVGAFATAGTEPGPHLVIAVCDEPESRPSAAGMPVPYINVEQVRAGIVAS
jgi:thiamine pyrophosphate-dependent acetolactate synthase large subunit-like protein